MVHVRLDEFTGDGNLGDMRHRAGGQTRDGALQQDSGQRFPGCQRVGTAVLVSGYQQNFGMVFRNFRATLRPTEDGELSPDSNSPAFSR